MVSKVAGPPSEDNLPHAQHLIIDQQQHLIQDPTKSANLLYDTSYRVEEPLSMYNFVLDHFLLELNSKIKITNLFFIISLSMPLITKSEFDFYLYRWNAKTSITKP